MYVFRSVRRPDARGPKSSLRQPGTFNIGEAPRGANLVKLNGSFFIASVLEALGEAMALVHKAGIDRQRYFAVVPTRAGYVLNSPGWSSWRVRCPGSDPRSPAGGGLLPAAGLASGSS